MGPDGVVATVCSQWAERRPSAVTTVHPSSRTAVSAVPMLNIGSMASAIPCLSLSPFPWRP